MTSAASTTTSPELLRSSSSKWTNWFIRTKSAAVLVAIVGGCVAAGHFGVMLLNTIIQALLFHELISLRQHDRQSDRSSHRSDEEDHETAEIVNLQPWYQWAWFALAHYLVTGLVLFSRFSLDESMGTIFTFLMRYHMLISFLAACFLFVYFIATLTPPYWPKIKSLFWTLIVILLIYGTTGPILSPLMDGLFWYIFPTILIAINDTAAYISGFFFGKHQLCQISPKKTIEGALGAFIVTIIVSYFLAGWMSNFPFVVCPKSELSLTPLVECSPDPVFLLKKYTIPYLNYEFVTKPIQLHGLFYGLFASSIAPFGGLFASAIKRALKIKDFSALIPGHGGVADRVDCQVFMLLFSTVWYSTFIKPYNVSYISYYSQYLPMKEQVALFEILQRRLRAGGYPV
ncbi:hypothetical protein P9112_009583 [Eukaryota sp. TZLM1-RC]